MATKKFSTKKGTLTQLKKLSYKFTSTTISFFDAGQYIKSNNDGRAIQIWNDSLGSYIKADMQDIIETSKRIKSFLVLLSADEIFIYIEFPEIDY